MNITLIQSDIIWEDLNQNLELFSNKINSIKHNTDLIVLPEMFATGFSMNPKQFANNYALQIDWLKEHSTNKKCTVTGSVINQINGSFYNSLIWMNPDGNYLVYNKRHLFSFAGEHLHYSPGNENITHIVI
jgi:predicted amidohydrolase